MLLALLLWVKLDGNVLQTFGWHHTSGREMMFFCCFYAGDCGYRRCPLGGILFICETSERLRGLENVNGWITVLGELSLLIAVIRCMRRVAPIMFSWKYCIWLHAHFISNFSFCVPFTWSAPAGGDYIKRRGSASDPPRATVQEEGRPSESGQPGDRTRQASGARQKQEARQIS